VATRTVPPVPDVAPSPESELSLGELVSRATADLSMLARKEVKLAKAEISSELAKAGKGAGLLGGAGFVAHLAVVFLSLSAMFGLAAWMPLGCAAFTVFLAFAAIAGGFALAGKRKLASLDPAPHRTIKTLKEDAEWARHPTS
jgi:hypothetical protein